MAGLITPAILVPAEGVSIGPTCLYYVSGLAIWASWKLLAGVLAPGSLVGWTSVSVLSGRCIRSRCIFCGQDDASLSFASLALLEQLLIAIFGEFVELFQPCRVLPFPAPLPHPEVCNWTLVPPPPGLLYPSQGGSAARLSKSSESALPATQVFVPVPRLC